MLFGIPLSLIGTIFGGVTGFLSKAWAMKQEMNAARDKHNMELLAKNAETEVARVNAEIKLLKARGDYETKASAADPHRSEARRYIAYAVTFGVVFLIPAMVLFGDPMWFDIKEFVNKDASYLFGLFGGKEITTFQTVVGYGIPLVWLDGMLTVLGTTVAFYMGGSAAKFNNPYNK